MIQTLPKGRSTEGKGSQGCFRLGSESLPVAPLIPTIINPRFKSLYRALVQPMKNYLLKAVTLFLTSDILLK